MDQGSDDVGAESVAARTARRSAPQDSPGWDKSPQPAFERQHSRKGWTGGNHWLNTDSVPGCRHRGRLDNLQALPTRKAQEGLNYPAYHSEYVCVCKCLVEVLGGWDNVRER